jgi:predicted amino acid racemase
VDPGGLTPPVGTRILGASSDHLVLDVGDEECRPGCELAFEVDYSALLRATTSPFVATCFR